jgi:tetratricopeptide (TPR) repeat protein
MKKINAFLFALFICFQSANAQPSVKDSINNLLKKNIPDTVRVQNLLYIADRTEDDNRSYSRLLIDSAERVAERSKSKKWLLQVYASKGNLYNALGKTDSALYFYTKVLQYENDSTVMQPVARVWGNLVNYYRQMGDLQSALKYSFKCEKYYTEQGKNNWLASVYANIGGIFFDLKDNKKALEYDKKAILLALENNFINTLPLLYRNLAAAYGENGKADSVMYYYRKALLLAEENDDIANTASSLQAIGYEYFLKNELDSASFYLLRTQQICEEEEYYDEGYPALYCCLGQIEAKRKNYDKAIAYLSKADSAAQSIGFVVDQIEIKKALKDVYAAKGNWQKAFSFQEQYVLLNDSMQRDENIRITRELEKKYDIAKKEKENLALKASNDLQQQKLNARNYLLIASGAVLALLALLLFFIFRNYRNQRKHVAILDKLNLQLTNQHNEILNINQLLQLKVLRTQMNPHFIYNCLNAINNLVMKGKNDKASNYLLSFSKLLRMILDFSDKTFVDLEDEINFIKLYLSLEALRMGSDFSYEVKTAQHILDDDIAVPSLLIQPFIENAIWHGLINKEGEKKLTVTFDEVSEKNHLRCVVEDNGIGRERSGEIKRNNHTMLHESKGIRITQERMELLRYQIKNEVSVNIKDKKNNLNQAEGTTVELVLPTQS